MTLTRIAIAAAAILLLLAFLWLNQCSETRQARTRADLAKGQAGAAMESGRDAANTAGNRAAADARIDAQTKEITDVIRNAEGADAPVAAGVRDAGLAGLCRSASYRNDPRCVQHARP
jgi:hypothetical protein